MIYDEFNGGDAAALVLPNASCGMDAPLATAALAPTAHFQWHRRAREWLPLRHSPYTARAPDLALFKVNAACQYNLAPTVLAKLQIIICEIAKLPNVQ